MQPQRIEVEGLATVEIANGNTVTVWLNEGFDGTVDFTSHDIDDFLENWKPGDVFYCSTEDTLESRRRIAVLFEALSEHPNGVLALMRLMEVLPENHRHLQEFVRTEATLSARICTRMLPPAPKTHYVYSFGELRPRFRWWHCATVIPMMAGVFGLIGLQTHFLSWMIHSPLTATVALGTKIGMWWAAIGGLVLLIFIDNKFGRRQKGMGYSPYTFGFFNRAAINEEQTFREGAENWKTWRRIRSCLSFGLIHQPSLIYIFGMFLPHVFMGGVFMAVYLHTYRRTNNRRAAVLAASVFHRVFNRVALSVLAVSLIIHFGHAGWNWVTAMVGVVFTWTVMVVSNHRKPASTKITS